MTHVLHQGNGWHTRAPIVQTNTGDNSDGKSNNTHYLLFLFFWLKSPRMVPLHLTGALAPDEPRVQKYARICFREPYAA